MVIPIGQTTCQRARLPTDATHIVSYWSTEKEGKGDLKGKLNPPSTIMPRNWRRRYAGSELSEKRGKWYRKMKKLVSDLRGERRIWV